MSRPLSPIEQALWLVDQEVRQNFIMIARISHQSGPMQEPILRKALDMIQEKYPPLRWKIKEGEVPEFVSDNVPPIPLNIIRRKNDDQWIEVAEKEMDEPFPFTEGPFIRVVLLSSENISDLLVTFCHIASDATSGLMVVKNILDKVGKLSRGENVVPESPLPPPISSIEALRKNQDFKSQTPETTNSTHEESIQSVELTPDVDVPPEKRLTRIIHRVLSPTETKKLATNGKKENTTVHGALCAAFLQAVVEQIRSSKEMPKEGPLPISCITAVNIRHLCPDLHEEDIGYYISFAVHYQSIDEKASLWNTARDIRESIQKEVDSGKDIEAILAVGEALKEFSKPLDLVRAINSSNPPVAITNLGRLNIPEQYGDLKLEELHFPVAIQFDTKNGFAIAVTTFKDRMLINFLYAEPFISKKRANIMTESTMKRLREAIK